MPNEHRVVYNQSHTRHCTLRETSFPGATLTDCVCRTKMKAKMRGYLRLPLRAEHTYGVKFRKLLREGSNQDSFVSLVSSMVMSLNSLASKISRHSRHSTNSASSSRATICTRGCLHSGMSLLFSGSWDGGIGFINPGCFSGPSGPERILPEFVRYCRTADLV